MLPKFKIGNVDLTSQPLPEQLERQNKAGNLLGMVALLVLLLVIGYFVASK